MRLLGMTTPDTRCITVCRDCGDTLPMPFTTYDARDEWETAHADATGHTFFRLDGWPHPDAVRAAMMFIDRLNEPTGDGGA